MPQIKEEQMEYAQQALNMLPAISSAGRTGPTEEQINLETVQMPYDGIGRDDTQIIRRAPLRSSTSKRPLAQIEDAAQWTPPAVRRNTRRSRGKTFSEIKNEQALSDKEVSPSPAPKRRRIASPEVSAFFGQRPYTSVDDAANLEETQTLFYATWESTRQRQPNYVYIGFTLVNVAFGQPLTVRLNRQTLFELVRSMKTHAQSFRIAPSANSGQEFLDSLVAVQHNLLWLHRARACIPHWLGKLQDVKYPNDTSGTHFCNLVFKIKQIVNEWHWLEYAAEELRLVQLPRLVMSMSIDIS